MFMEIKQKLRINIRLVGSFRIFCFSGAADAMTEHIFPDRSSTSLCAPQHFHCFDSIPYYTKSIGRRYYCCGDLVENKRQIWFLEA
jgi:hypothetical protein